MSLLRVSFMTVSPLRLPLVHVCQHCFQEIQTYDSNFLARIHRERDVLQHGHIRVVVEADVLEFNRCALGVQLDSVRSIGYLKVQLP